MTQAPQFSQLLSPNLLWGLFSVTTAGTIIISIVLWYHWREYAIHGSALTIMKLVYFAAIATFIALQAVSLTSI